MNELLFEESFTKQELFSIAKTLNDNYHAFLLDCQVWDLLEKVFPNSYFCEELKPLMKEVIGHRIVNDVVMGFYAGEKKVKYHLAKQYINRQDEISFFEFNVGSSRVDFARINGHSYAYEIKTELDSLEKLEKQIKDYSKVFEYVQIIIHPKHYKKVLTIVPEFCGIATYNSDIPSFPFAYRRKRMKNPYIDPAIQVSSLTIKELHAALKICGIQDLPKERLQIEELLLNICSPNKINHLFKKHIKKRFQKRWFHICEHIEKIEPVDLQSFFKSTIDPDIIYYKNSSMV